MNMNNLVLDMPISSFLKGIGEQGLPDGHPAEAFTLRQAYDLRAFMSSEEANKMEILINVLNGMTLQDMHDLKKRYEMGDLNPQEKLRIANIKAAMMQ